MVDGGTMVSLLVRNHKFAGLRRVTLPSSRTLRAVYGYAVFDESDPLQSQKTSDPQCVRGRPPAEKNLGGTPVTSLRGDFQSRHSIAPGQLVPVGTCR